MSLNTDLYGINNISTTGVSGKRVKVTVDGRDLGTAAEVVVDSQIFGKGNPSVDLKDLDGLANVSFYGYVYRDLRKANKELERKVRLADQVADSRSEDTAYWHNAYEVAEKKATERYAEINRLKGELQAKAEPIDTLQLRYDIRVRDVQIAELKAEVERLLQSRKEQAEKHNKKQANLQANFEQRTAGKLRNTKLQRELESSQSYNEHLKLCVQEKDAELVEVKSKLDTAVENAKYLAERSDNLESRLRDVKAASAIWHEKFLADADAQLDIAVSKYDYLVDSVNGISDIVNDAANRQGFDLG